MKNNEEQRNAPAPEEKLPAAPTGNASNPSADNASGIPQEDSQLLSGRAEKYLRESASIEDMPDEQDWQEAEQTLRDDAADSQNKA